MTGETLFLAHRVPFPPDRGDKIRSHNVLRALAALGPVHVGTFDDGSGYGDQFLSGIAASHHLVPRRKHDLLAAAEAMAKGHPVSLSAFANEGLRQWVAQVLHYRPIDAIYVFSGQMAQYVPVHFPGRTVLDLCDVDSAKFEAYGEAGHGPKAWVHAREARLLAATEERFARMADTTLLISENEANLFRTRVSSMHQIDLRVMRNGIDAKFFAPGAVKPEPTLYGRGPSIVFTGQMDYAPNVAAVERMAQRILPAIREVHRDAEFHIVGRAPTPAAQIIAGYKQIVARAHARGIKIFGATLTPYEGAAYFTPAGELVRQEVNEFIRNGGTFDGVIDFDRAIQDPANPSRILPALTEDNLHPNDMGYKLMADSIDLSLFR